MPQFCSATGWDRSTQLCCADLQTVAEEVYILVALVIRTHIQILSPHNFLFPSSSLSPASFSPSHQPTNLPTFNLLPIFTCIYYFIYTPTFSIVGTQTALFQSPPFSFILQTIFCGNIDWEYMTGSRSPCEIPLQSKELNLGLPDPSLKLTTLAIGVVTFEQ